jgi:hypothetical protein
VLSQLPAELLRCPDLEVRGDRGWGGIFAREGRSHFGAYRYLLWRLFDPLLSPSEPDWAHFVMLNPSKAEPGTLDNTFTKVCSFARRWGKHGVILTNLDPRVSTDPRGLAGMRAALSIKWNLVANEAAASVSRESVCAWGGPYSPRALQVNVVDVNARVLWNSVLRARRTVALAVTKDGYPRHPLYLPLDSMPLLWSLT